MILFFSFRLCFSCRCVRVWFLCFVSLFRWVKVWVFPVARGSSWGWFRRVGFWRGFFAFVQVFVFHRLSGVCFFIVPVCSFPWWIRYWLRTSDRLVKFYCVFFVFRFCWVLVVFCVGQVVFPFLIFPLTYAYVWCSWVSCHAVDSNTLTVSWGRQITFLSDGV